MPKIWLASHDLDSLLYSTNAVPSNNVCLFILFCGLLLMDVRLLKDALYSLRGGSVSIVI